MSIKYVLEAGIFERLDIHSGRIYQEGSPPKYGVIFTANESMSEDDLGLDPNLMLGAFLGKLEFSESEKDLFFEILGGYFFIDNYPDPGITRKVFGIALDPQFGITEGGTTTLKDRWKLDDPDRPILDESYWSKKFGKHHGWTFIVTLKEMEKYPTSSDEMKIVAYCPEIKEIAFEISNCEYDSLLNLLKRKVIFKSLIGEAVPKNWIWQFGDGETDSGTGKPPEIIEHLYKQKPDSAPKLCLTGHQACDEICQEIELTGFEVCPECPRIMQIDHKIKQKDENITTAEFSLGYSGNTPEKFTWNWGDESPEETTTNLTISHDYKMLESGPATYTVKVTISGPDECQDSGQTTVTIPQKVICPQMKKMTVNFCECKTQDNKRIRKVSFVPSIEGETPDHWILDFGDGSIQSGDGALPPSIDHFYEKRPSVAPTLTLIGPKSCKDTKLEIDLTGFEECPPCPQIISIVHTMKDKDENYKTVEFVLTIDGLNPEKSSWDWGDGSPTETTTEPTVSHDYRMFESGPQQYTVTVTTIGPEDCKDSEQITIEIPARQKPVEPKLCFFMPLLVAFLLASTFATLIVYNVAKIYQKMQNFELLVPIAIIFAILTVLAIIFWYHIRKTKSCLGSIQCDWRGIGWVVFSVGTLISLYLRSYSETSWWAAISIFLIVAVILLFVWLRKCAVKVVIVIVHSFVC